MDILRKAMNKMDFLKFGFLAKKKVHENVSASQKYDLILYKLQSILTWEHPNQSIGFLIIIHLIFCIIIKFGWKLYGLIFITLLVHNTHSVWTEKIWPEIRLAAPSDSSALHKQSNTTNQRIIQLKGKYENILSHLNVLFIRLKHLRRSDPMLFCSTMSFIFGSLFMIGSLISGIWLSYIIVMILFLSPGIYIFILPVNLKHLLIQWIDNVLKFIYEESKTVDEYEDYVPNLTEENVREAYASVFDVDYIQEPEESGDSITHFPDISAVIDDLDKFNVDVKLEFSETNSVCSDISDSIKIQKVHLEEDSNVGELSDSSEDGEKAFLPYLRHGKNVDNCTSDSSSSILSELNKIGANIISNIIPVTALTPKNQPYTSDRNNGKKRSESVENFCTDDEFEFVEKSDLI